jgi:putative hydrolase of the HAD superfamily
VAPDPLPARALLFDLDDTLFEERAFVESGFRMVGRWIADRACAPASAVHARLLAVLDAEGRGRVFDRVLEEFGLPADTESVDALVSLYRSHTPDIRPYPGVLDLLCRLSDQFRLAIVTDGASITQRAKVVALGLEPVVDTVVYCWDLDAPKPAIRGYQVALARLGLDAPEAVVVGDRPDHDGVAARALGAGWIRVRSGRYATAPDPDDLRPDRSIATILELEEAVTPPA